MKPRRIRDNVSLLGAVDWDRRIFDSLIPIPHGTSYNSYLVQGTEKTALIDTVDPSKTSILMEQLADVARIDYVVSNHAEPDHSGSIPPVLARYPDARLVVTPKGKTMLHATFGVDEARFLVVENGFTLSLGDRTLKFLHMPWVHWPETMVTYLAEEKMLFSCDLFGSHLATNDVFAREWGRVYSAAKRYYAEIMMPFRTQISRHLSTLEDYPIETIAPSHGPLYDDPSAVLGAYRDWVLSPPKNFVAVLAVSMHGSTKKLVDRLVAELTDLGVGLQLLDLTRPELDQIAMALVDAGTIALGTPTVLAGPHPNTVYAAYLASILRPKAKFAAVVGSFGWGSQAASRLSQLLAPLKLEFLEPVQCTGAPTAADYEKIVALAGAIAQKHKEQGFS